LHFNVLQTYTSARASPIPSSSRSSSLPAWPTNGSPCLSSWKPGASPTSIRSASGWPFPKTTCVRPSASRQRVQTEASRASSASVVWLRSVAAATAPAAAAAPGSTAEARLHGGAVSREHRELLRHLDRPAVGAARALAGSDELLEVGFALHADVLVDRHRHGSLGTRPDARQALPVTMSEPGIH